MKTTATNRKPKIFLCYSSSDKEIAYVYKTKLKLLNIDVSMGAAINSGENFFDVMHKELISADLIIMLLSKKFILSDWMTSDLTGSLFSYANEKCLIIREKDISVPPVFKFIRHLIVQTISEIPNELIIQNILQQLKGFVEKKGLLVEDNFMIKEQKVTMNDAKMKTTNVIKSVMTKKQYFCLIVIKKLI